MTYVSFFWKVHRHFLASSWTLPRHALVGHDVRPDLPEGLRGKQAQEDRRRADHERAAARAGVPRLDGAVQAQRRAARQVLSPPPPPLSPPLSLSLSPTPLTHAHRALHFACRASSCRLRRGVARDQPGPCPTTALCACGEESPFPAPAAGGSSSRRTSSRRSQTATRRRSCSLIINK